MLAYMAFVQPWQFYDVLALEDVCALLSVVLVYFMFGPILCIVTFTYVHLLSATGWSMSENIYNESRQHMGCLAVRQTNGLIDRVEMHLLSKVSVSENTEIPVYRQRKIA